MSTRITLNGLTRRYGQAAALSEVDAEFVPGALVAVVGPSGCGKTTLLRLIGGLDRPDSGEVWFDGAPFVGRPEQRPTAMVWQQAALFPDLDVAQNIGFGLAARGQRGALLDEHVAVAILRLGLTGLEARYPDELSGGQQRRVAIAQALVTQPRVLLLDEPLAGLDQNLARSILRQIRQLHQRLGLTTVLVTHDQSDALLVADQIVLMNAGRIVQTGSPQEVFDHPNSIFAAEFWGRSSFIEVEPMRVNRPGEGSDRAEATVWVFGRVRTLPAHPDIKTGMAASVLIRPHLLTVRAAPPESGVNVSGDLGIVQETHYLGDRIEYLVETEEGMVLGTGAVDQPQLEPMQLVQLTLDESRAWLLPAEQL